MKSIQKRKSKETKRLKNFMKKSFNGRLYEWWYWKNLIRNMKKNLDQSKLKAIDTQNPEKKPGIAFSFDDSYRIEHWIKYGKDLFGFYDVKVTFNINAFHPFEGEREHTQKEIDYLLELQANGHEIAHHSLKHKNADTYSKEAGISRWIEDEIVSMFNWMEKQAHSKTNEKFKKPVTFALPYSAFNEDIIKELVSKYFKIVRGHLNGDNLTPFDHHGFAPAIGIDRIFLSDIKYIKKILKMAKQTGKNIIFMCHSILPEEVKWGDFGWGEDSIVAGEWRISPETIQAIINEAKKLDMEFYTTTEIAGVATFIDRNLESCIRNLISNPKDQWISISELSLIKELDLSGKNISNLDGIQYFTNLEKIDLRDNYISNFRLLKKLPKLKEIDISNNVKSQKKIFEGSPANTLQESY